MENRLVSSLKTLLPFVGITIFVYILLRIGLTNIWASIKLANFFYLFLALLFLIPIYLLTGFKWNYLIKKQGLKVSNLFLMKAILMGEFYGVITPGKLGTLTRIKYLSEKVGKSLSICAPSVVIDRVMDFLGVLIVSLFGVLTLYRYFSQYAILISISLIIFIILFIVMFNKKVNLIVNFIVPFSKNMGFLKFIDNFYSNLPKFKTMIIAVILAIIYWLVIYIQEYFVLLAVHVSLPFGFFIVSQAIATIILLIPITINGLGTRDVTLISMFSLFNIPASATLAYSILSMLMLAFIPWIFGLMILLKRRVKKQ